MSEQNEHRLLTKEEMFPLFVATTGYRLSLNREVVTIYDHTDYIVADFGEEGSRSKNMRDAYNYLWNKFEQSHLYHLAE